MKFKTLFALSAALIGFGSVASAAVYTDVKYIVEHLDGENPSYSGSFDITKYGQFSPGSEEVVSATVSFLFFGINYNNDPISIDVAGDAFTGGKFFLLQLVGGSLSNALSALNADGKIDFSVSINQGGAWLKAARIDAVTRPIRAVPDSASTLALLGVGILGLAAVRRRIGAR